MYFTSFLGERLLLVVYEPWLAIVSLWCGRLSENSRTCNINKNNGGWSDLIEDRREFQITFVKMLHLHSARVLFVGHSLLHQAPMLRWPQTCSNAQMRTSPTSHWHCIADRFHPETDQEFCFSRKSLPMQQVVEVLFHSSEVTNIYRWELTKISTKHFNSRPAT